MKFNSKKIFAILSVGVCLSAGIGSIISESNPQTSTAASVKKRVLPKKYRGDWVSAKGIHMYGMFMNDYQKGEHDVFVSHVTKKSCTLRSNGLSGDYQSVRYAIKHVKYNHKNYKVLAEEYLPVLPHHKNRHFYVEHKVSKKVRKGIFKKYQLSTSYTI